MFVLPLSDFIFSLTAFVMSLSSQHMFAPGELTFRRKPLFTDAVADGKPRAFSMATKGKAKKSITAVIISLRPQSTSPTRPTPRFWAASDEHQIPNYKSTWNTYYRASTVKKFQLHLKRNNLDMKKPMQLQQETSPVDPLPDLLIGNDQEGYLPAST